MVRLTQMKWNGIVSQYSQWIIPARFATANANHASSTRLRRRNSVTGMADGLDGGGGPELLAQAPDADVYDVRAGVEVVSPDLREQALAAHHLAGALEQVMEEPELAVREIDDVLPDAGLPAGNVQRESSDSHDVAVPVEVGRA